MIDPIHSLAFSIQANRGVYAVLFGSGISRSAKIPTGWEITLDLVRKLAAVAGEECGAKPDEWYRAKYEREPDYSELLDAVAKTAAERQQLLRTYWEPTEDEREEGAKQPTAAHRAIAQLVSKGFIKVIVTTNFDRLMEMALAEVGVVPTVLSTADQVHGALPLIHTQCCLFKVHGDYLDTRILNTPEELSAYPAEFDELLDRIFDEFGLIVCGWSADWDEALRRAMTRAPSRRFATYWAARGGPSASAQQLIDHRGAQVVSIKDADSFFLSVQQQVESLEEFARPHPLSTEAAVAALKKYMSEPRYRIKHSDLVYAELERVLVEVSPAHFPVNGGSNPDATQFNRRVRAYDAAMGTLTAMAVEAGRWAEDKHHDVWISAIQALAAPRTQNGGFVLWLELEKFPAMLMLYALGVVAVQAGQYSFVQKLLLAEVARENGDDKLAVQILPSGTFFKNDGDKWLEGFESRHAPLSDWILAWAEPITRRHFPTKKSLEHAFDKFEIIMALAYGARSGRSPEWYWAPPGAFGYRTDNRQKILAEIDASITKFDKASPYVATNLFGETAEVCRAQIAALNEFIPKLRWY